MSRTMTSTSVRLRIWGATRGYRFATPQIRITALSYENDHLPRFRYGMMDRVPFIKDPVAVYPRIMKTLLGL